MRETTAEAPTQPFPRTYAELSTERLLDVFSAAPDRIGAAVDGLSEEDLRARPVPGKWSIHEIALHLTDSECLGAVRIRQAIGDAEARFPGYDQDRWAASLRYADRPPEARRAALALFRAHREATSGLFAGARPEDWSRGGRHPEWGAITVRQLLELYADHGERHLAQVLERRRLLGRPLNLPLSLPTRLY